MIKQPILTEKTDTIYINPTSETLTKDMIIKGCGIKIVDNATNQDITKEATINLDKYSINPEFDNQPQRFTVEINNGIAIVPLAHIFVINVGDVNTPLASSNETIADKKTHKRTKPLDKKAKKYIKWGLIGLLALIVFGGIHHQHQINQVRQNQTAQVSSQASNNSNNIDKNKQKIKDLKNQVHQLEQNYKNGGNKKDYQNGLNNIKSQLAQIQTNNRFLQAEVNALTALINRIYNINPSKISL